MKLTTFKNVIRMMMVALISTSVAIGCGDGKSKRRQPIKKGKATPQTAEQAKAAAKEIKAKSEVGGRIDGQIQQLSSGQLIDKGQLEEGIYELKTVTSSLKYFYKTDDVRVIGSSDVSINSAGQAQLSPVNSVLATGGLSQHSDVPRNVEVAHKITVKKDGGTFSGAADAFLDKFLIRTEVKTALVSGEMKTSVSIEARNTDKNGSLVKASIAEMLAGSGVVSTDKKDIKYTVQDENGKTVDLRIFKVSENRVNLVFEISENNSKGANQPTANLRIIVLAYDFTKAAAQKTADTAHAEPAAPARVDAPVEGAAPVAAGDDLSGQQPAAAPANDTAPDAASLPSDNN